MPDIFVLTIALIAFFSGCMLPTRWGLIGFISVGVILFSAQAGVKTVTGFGGSSIADSLALFNDSWGSYIGFNLQLTYRAFSPALMALAIPFIFRLSRNQRT
jgi:hypothetical protein